MNTVIAVVVIGLMVGLVVMMVRYARFIHRYPREMQDKIDRESAADGKDFFPLPIVRNFLMRFA